MGSTIVREWSVRCLWLAHRKELIEQAARTLERLGLEVGIIKNGVRGNPDAPVQVASVQSLVRRRKPEVDLVVIDEAHHATAGSYESVLREYPGTPVLGLTATPFRLDGTGLGDVFNELTVAARTDELCTSGILHAPRVWTTRGPNLRNMRVIAGDYAMDDLARIMNQDEANTDIVEMWKRHGVDKRTVCFATNVQHSIAIVEKFINEDIDAEHLDGSMDAETREAILERLRIGKTKIVSNCMVLTEGWDLPSLEVAIIARPTASLNLHLQMIGRIMRTCEDKSGCVVLDHAGNHHVHGPVTRRLVYSLENVTRADGDELGLRRCPQCGFMFDNSMVQCPECLFIAARRPGTPADTGLAGTDELVEFNENSIEYRRRIWNELEAERARMGYRPGWSWFRYRERFGVDPCLAGDELIDPAEATTEQKILVYRMLLVRAVDAGRELGWATHRYKEIFGVWPGGRIRNVLAEFEDTHRRSRISQRFAELMRRDER